MSDSEALFQANPTTKERTKESVSQERGRRRTKELAHEN